ncbi:hypothetical protein C8R42DRAFT_726038 [Lentinula raphanica]|nr:hypothetical protein C8R42DRAFT_726038 [Lentinula raphanica]
MRLQRIYCDTKIAILGILCILGTVAALPTLKPYQVRRPSYPSSSTSQPQLPLFDSQMIPQSLAKVGYQYEWTVTIWFPGKLELGNDVDTRFDAVAICQNIATALQPYLPPNTLFYLPGRSMVPRWDEDNMIEFQYSVQLGLPSTFRKRFGSGSGKVRKTGHFTLDTTIFPTKAVPKNVPALPINTYQISYTESPNILVDSEMIPPSPKDIGFNVWIATIAFDAPLGFVEDNMDSRYDALLICKNIATALQPYLPEKTLFHFADRVPYWNEENVIKFTYFLQQGLPLKPQSRKEKNFGSGEVKKTQIFTLKTTIHPQESASPPTHRAPSSSLASTSTNIDPVNLRMRVTEGVTKNGEPVLSTRGGKGTMSNKKDFSELDKYHHDSTFNPAVSTEQS